MNKMISTYKTLGLGLLLIVVTSTSCSDYFELERPPQSPWLTLDEFERAPIGAYGILFSSHEWRQVWPYYAIAQTSFGDDIEWVDRNKWNYWRVTPRGTTTTEMSEALVYQIYRGIGAVNDALDFVEENEGNPFPEASEKDIEHNLNRIVGELHFLRGFCYYMLQSVYGHAYVPGGSNDTPDLPLVLSFAASTDDAINPEVGTTQQVWDQILEDLLTAKDLVPERYDQALHNESFQVRANKFAVSAMLMRTYFQRGEYDLAEDEADYILTEGASDYNLSEDPIEAFNKSGLIERGAETIWYLPYSDQTLYPPNHLSVLNVYWNGSPCTWSETRMGTKTIQRIGWKDNPGAEYDTIFNQKALNDKRFSQLMMRRYPIEVMLEVLGDKGYKNSFNLSTNNGVLEFETELSKMNAQLGTHFQVDNREVIQDITTLWPWKYYRGPGEDYTNVPLIRLAEVYLTRSIIRFNAGNMAGAASDLNVVKARAWNQTAAGSSYQPVTAGSITADMIHDERLIEMFNEGDRLNYLRGLKVDIPEGDRGPGSDPYTSEIFIYPLPESEVIYNKNIN